MEEQNQELENQDNSFDEGFEIGAEEDRIQESGQNAVNPGVSDQPSVNGQPEQTEQPAQPENNQASVAQEQAPQEDPTQETPPDKTLRRPSEQPQYLQEAPEGIRDELETLKRLNPNAAQLALEDSPEGEAIRKRLENYGAEIAQDRAESTLEKRRLATARQQQEEARIQAHNRNFMEHIRQNQPEYFKLITDPNRKTEAQKYFRSVFDWIGDKPYKEAERLMRVAQSGRDPAQICQLIKDFEASRQAKKRPDATGAYAVPSRGMPAAQAGIGDKDDFEAGWDMNRD